MLTMENGILILTKGGKEYKEGSENTRKITKGLCCPVCNQEIKKGDGYKMLNSSTFFHTHKECKHQFTASESVQSKLTKIPMLYDVKVWTKESVIHTLTTNEWNVKSNNYVECKLNNLNPLRVIDSLQCSKVIITITNTITQEQKRISTKNSKGIFAHKLADNMAIQLGKYKY